MHIYTIGENLCGITYVVRAIFTVLFVSSNGVAPAWQAWASVNDIIVITIIHWQSHMTSSSSNIPLLVATSPTYTYTYSDGINTSFIS